MELSLKQLKKLIAINEKGGKKFNKVVLSFSGGWCYTVYVSRKYKKNGVNCMALIKNIDRTGGKVRINLKTGNSFYIDEEDLKEIADLFKLEKITNSKVKDDTEKNK